MATLTRRLEATMRLPLVEKKRNSARMALRFGKRRCGKVCGQLQGQMEQIDFKDRNES